ncbi:MAG: hypothetical protein K0S21_2821 [Rhizobiaceae bacterium]|nr:hypothetical protein [Rhizobiaceae bacterium]
MGRCPPVPPEDDLSDDALALAFCEACRGRLAYDRGWHIRAGAGWRRDTTRQILHLILRFLRATASGGSQAVVYRLRSARMVRTIKFLAKAQLADQVAAPRKTRAGGARFSGINQESGRQRR